MARRNASASLLIATALTASLAGAARAQSVPPDERGTSDAERSGYHDAANIRTVFWNYGMVGDYPTDPGGVDLSVFHSAEAPKGSGMNYTDGITPFVLAKITQRNGADAYIMETGFRERQGISPYHNRTMRFEPRPGFLQLDPSINEARAPAISSDVRTWPHVWPDKLDDPDDPGWAGSWNGYFGKRAAADQESYMVMDDDYYDAWDYFPDANDSTRHGLGLRIEVRGFQWANPQAGNVVFWHYDITNEGTTDYNDNIVFGLYMDSGVGGSALSCDGIYESDDDNAYFNRTFDEDVINLVYTWDRFGHGRDLSGPCGRTGYLGYAYLETPGNAIDALDNDEDGITDERRDGGEGQRIEGAAAILAEVTARYDLERFVTEYGPVESRPAYRAGVWWTGDEDLDWNPEFHDTGADGVLETGDAGEADGQPSPGEPYFDATDLNESDQIGLTGFKFNRIRVGQGNPDPHTDNILFFTNPENWPQRLYEQFTDPDPEVRFDDPIANNYNLGFLFASGPFTLAAGKTERFSLALAYGGDLDELRRTVNTVQQIYDANYQFATPPPAPVVTAESGDGWVRLSWSDVSERGIDPVTNEIDFEGYRIYRSTDPEFRDPRVITTGTGSGTFGNGKPIAQFDLVNGREGYSEQTYEGVAYYLGTDNGIQHTWTDSTVTNGQQYYYAVTSYDYGPEFTSGLDRFRFYPSENSIAVTSTLRGGTILPPNVVAVRPEPKVAGYVPASATAGVHIKGEGIGTAHVEVVNSNLVADGHLYVVSFQAPENQIHAEFYTLADSTSGEVLFSSGKDFGAAGTGPVGGGLLPYVYSIPAVEIDTLASGWEGDGPTNAELDAFYSGDAFRNLRRPGYPNDLRIEFTDTFADTGLFILPFRATPAKFRVFAQTDTGAVQLDFRFRDNDADGTLSVAEDVLDILTVPEGETPAGVHSTWRVQLDPDQEGEIIPPAAGDVYRLVLRLPLTVADRFVFEATGERVDDVAKGAFEPYVVPNPYVGAASFEPERFAVSGRGERRIEFRGLPQSCKVRIFTLRGDHVETLDHDGGDDGFVAWDLRTKDNLDVAPGLYVYQVDAGARGTKIGKFAVIK